MLTIRDLGFLTGPPADAASKNLVATWERNWLGLGEHDESADNISADIGSVRNSVVAVLVAPD